MLITQRPIVEAMSEGGADQLSPCQALPKTINPTILYYANHQEGKRWRAGGAACNGKEWATRG